MVWHGKISVSTVRETQQGENADAGRKLVQFQTGRTTWLEQDGDTRTPGFCVCWKPMWNEGQLTGLSRKMGEQNCY